MTLAETIFRAAAFSWCLFVAAESAAEPAARQSIDDAWFTGPMLAPSAGTLPRGHVLIEPYLYDVVSSGSDGFGSLTYINYGLTDRLTVGMIPTFGYNRVGGGAGSSHVGTGDVSVQAQWRLTRFDADSRVPTMSINLQQSLPTGRFDRLGERTGDGLGSGARTTTLGWYLQTYFWMPNGRILRTRLNFSYAHSRSTRVEDISVYGTAQGFRGRATPGSAWTANLAFEYSLTRSWALALDLIHRQASGTRVIGRSSPSARADDVRIDGGGGTSFAFAPAVEYNWSARVGLLLGVRVIPRTHSAPSSVTPAVALNLVF